MATLPEETLASIFDLLRQLADQIEYASATEWQLFTEYGENERTLSELEELSNARERITLFCQRRRVRIEIKALKARGGLWLSHVPSKKRSR
jgi:hypothetical protein